MIESFALLAARVTVYVIDPTLAVTTTPDLQDDESLGAVEQGRLADMVLLDANPLSDIRNTRKIAGVVVGGRYVPKGRSHP